jgi:hypothetical protein
LSDAGGHNRSNATVGGSRRARVTAGSRTKIVEGVSFST